MTAAASPAPDDVSRGPAAARGATGFWLLTLLALALAAWSMAPLMGGQPWQHGWLGHNGARYAQIGRNHARFGWAHGGAPLLSVAPAPGEAPTADVYGHHPPGVGWLLGALFAATGDAADTRPESLSGMARVARRSAAAATLLALAALGLLLRRVACGSWAGLGVLLAAAMPMTAIYGAHVEVQGPYVLAASVLTLLAYGRWRDSGSWVPFALAALLASAFDWYGLYAPAFCALHLALGPRRRLAAGVAVGVGTLALFGGWLGWLATRPGMSLERVFGAAGVRGAAGLGVEDDVVAQYLETCWRDANALMPYGPVLLLVVLGGLAMRLAGWRGRPASAAEGAGAAEHAESEGSVSAFGPGWLVACLLGAPLLHAALFPAGMLVHAYWLFALPLGLAAGVVLVPRGLLRGVGLVFALIGAAIGISARDEAAPAADPIAAMVGTALAAHTAPGATVLTNYETNVLVPGADGDRYVTMRPAVTFHADRRVRGGVGLPGEPGVIVALDEALARLPGIDAYLQVPAPWGAEPSPALTEALAARAVGEPVKLSDVPIVRLWRLR